VNSYDLDSLRLLARQRQEQRLHEAETERLARAVRGTGRRTRRLRLPVGLALAAWPASPPATARNLDRQCNRPCHSKSPRAWGWTN
jgi:hypothetical protein